MRIAGVLVLSCVTLGCGQPSERLPASALSDSDQAAFEQMFIQWEASMDAADAGAHNRLFFTDDVIIIPPDRGPFIGEGDLEQVLTQHRPTGSTISDPEIEVTGDWALVRARFSTTWEPVNEGVPFEENSRYVWVLRRQPDQSWKIARFIFYPLQ